MLFILLKYLIFLIYVLMTHLSYINCQYNVFLSLVKSLNYVQLFYPIPGTIACELYVHGTNESPEWFSISLSRSFWSRNQNYFLYWQADFLPLNRRDLYDSIEGSVFYSKPIFSNCNNYLSLSPFAKSKWAVFPLFPFEIFCYFLSFIYILNYTL